MKMNDIEAALEDRLQRSVLQSRSTGLLSDQRGQGTPGAVQAVDDNAVILGGQGRRDATAEAESVLAVHDLDLVARARDGARERLHVHGIAAKVIRRIERRD